MSIHGIEPVGFVEPMQGKNAAITFNTKLGQWGLAGILGFENKKHELYTREQVIELLQSFYVKIDRISPNQDVWNKRVKEFVNEQD